MIKLSQLTKDALLSTMGAMILLAPVAAHAATSASVTATVTAQNVSVSVSDGTVAYGTLSTNTASDTTSGGTDDSQTATNNGNITEDISIKGSNSAAWTLGATASTDQYIHQFCKTNCDSSPTWTSLTTSYQDLATDVSASGTQVFDLKITTPTSTSSYTQQSVDVTILAAAS